jgi:predicted ATPase
MSRFEIGQGLVARGEAVAELNRAFDRVINGCSSIEVVSIRGVSGSGKSKLVSVWLDSLGESRRATVALSKLDRTQIHPQRLLSSHSLSSLAVLSTAPCFPFQSTFGGLSGRSSTASSASFRRCSPSHQPMWKP